VIYLDHNAGAPLWPEVARFLGQAWTADPGNPSSVHKAGRAWRSRLQQARETVARLLGCEPREVIFTASGSESASLAITGVWHGRKDLAKQRIVSTSIEHPGVLGALSALEAQGAEVIRVAPGADGRVSLEAVLEQLTPATALCTVMWANNETGVLQPVSELARACHERGIIFHTDAVQAIGKVNGTLRDVPADLLSISGHKVGAPPGTGLLIARPNVDLAALVPGHQEKGRRGGTPNVVLLEALALALDLSMQRRERDVARMQSLREQFEISLLRELPTTIVHGKTALRLPNTSNFRLPHTDGEALLIALDLDGICASSGAACASGSLTPSHVLTAMGLSSAQAQSTMRFSFGHTTTEAEIDTAVAAIVRHVAALPPSV
jgi:cysteine desulfurase